MEQVINNISIKKSQKYLGERGLVIFIVSLSAFIPLSIDIYLPALPTMATVFGDTTGLINFTLIAFFIFFGLSTLIWGPLSDKFGRKPILLVGLSIYVIGSILCISANNIYMIILYRIIQAIGSGSVVAVAGAIVKDSFEGRKGESVMAIVQSMTMLAPAIAPVLGAFILKSTSWRGIFVLLTVFGIGAFLGAIFFQETINKKHTGNIFSSIGRLVHVAKNPRFSSLMMVFLLSSISIMSFVSASAYIYVNEFKLTEQTYSFYFALNAIFAIIGPLAYIKISKHFSKRKIIMSSFIMIIISGFLVYSIGAISPLVFALMLIPGTFFSSLLRPLGTMLMFDQQKGDVGSASSLMNFVATILGSFGMFLVTLNFIDNIKLIGLINLIAAFASLVLWLSVSKKYAIK